MLVLKISFFCSYLQCLEGKNSRIFTTTKKRCGSAEVTQNFVIDVRACYQLGLMSNQLHKQEGLCVWGLQEKVLDHGTL